MGYVRDEDFAFPISPFHAFGTVAAWAMQAGAVAGTLAFACDATDETAHLFIEVRTPSHKPDAQGNAIMGFKLVDIELDFETLIAANDALSAVVNKVKRGANGAVHVVTTPTFAYDSGHDSAAERLTLDQHRMTLTLDTPIWVEDDEYFIVDLTIDKAATSTFQFLGGVAHGILRA